MKENSEGKNHKDINNSDPTVIYFEIIRRLEKVKWINSKEKFRIGCSESIIEDYATILNLNQETLLLNLNNFLAKSSKKVIPFLKNNEIIYFIISDSNYGGLELDNFTAGIFGIIVGLIELSNGKIEKKELYSLFSENIRLNKRISQINRAIKFLISMNFLYYNSKEQTYELGSIGQVIISQKARKDIGKFFQDNIYK